MTHARIRTIACLGCALLASACGSVRNPTASAAETHAAQPQPPVVAPPSQAALDATVATATKSDAAVVSAVTPASAEAIDPVAAVLALSPSCSTSIGAPGAGSVQGSVALPDLGPGFAHNEKRPSQARFGAVEIVQAIIRAAAALHEALPESTVVVNDIGLEHGGPIAQHGSHQAGRDADILFQLLDRSGKPMPSVGVPLDPKGRGWDFKDLAIAKDDVAVRFDARRTWRFVAELLQASGDDVQRILLVEHLRTMLLAEADRVHAKKMLRERFALVTCQPETPHDDHMHVRFFCSPEDIGHGCIDGAPMYPFRRGALRALGVQPVLETYGDRHKRKRARDVEERTTSPSEARAHAEKSGPLHAKVRAFLDARELWSSKPSPGRPYCK